MWFVEYFYGIYSAYQLKGNLHDLIFSQFFGFIFSRSLPTRLSWLMFNVLTELTNDIHSPLANYDR